MKGIKSRFMVICSSLLISGFRSEQVQVQVKSDAAAFLLQQSRSVAKTKVQLENSFVPTSGSGGNLKASLEGVCREDSYQPSVLEQSFIAHASDWTADATSLCEHLGSRMAWIQENTEGSFTSGTSIFSRLCKKGKPPELLEPLAGILRNPRFICDGVDFDKEFDIDWLVLADHGRLSQPAKSILFDAGGSRFMDSMHWFASQYEKRGIVFDNIYVWEAIRQGTEAYWSGTAPEVRQKWEARLIFYDGVPVSAEEHSDHNPIKRILADCRLEDFCAFKLDIDTPSVELPIVEQLLASPAVASVLDEFFFEHHVHGLMQQYGWGPDVNGTFTDSYQIFTKLRSMGVRAHSWI